MKKIDKIVDIKFVNFNYSVAVEEYVLRKIYKHENESSHIDSVKVILSSITQNRDKIYEVSVEVELRNAGFIIKKTGKDIYGLVDIMSDTYRKRLVKFIDVHSDHKESIKAKEIPLTADLKISEPILNINNSFHDVDVNKYVILEEKGFNDHTPMHVEEAIDLMELIERQCILFKNIKTGKYSVVYKISDGVKEGYGIINAKM